MKKISLLLVLLTILQLFLTACKSSSSTNTYKPRGNLSADVENYETVTNVYKSNFINIPDGYTMTPNTFYRDNRIYVLCNPSVITAENYNSKDIIISFDIDGSNLKLITLDPINKITKFVILSDDSILILTGNFQTGENYFRQCSSDGLTIDRNIINNIPYLNYYDVIGMTVTENDEVFICTLNNVYMIQNISDGNAVKMAYPSKLNMSNMFINNDVIYVATKNGNIFTVNVDEYTLESFAVIKMPENIKSQYGEKYTHFGPGYDIYYNTFFGLYCYTAGSEEAELLIDWNNSDIIGTSVNIDLIISPELIITFVPGALTSSYHPEANEIRILTKVPDDEVTPKILIKLAYVNNPGNITILMQLALRFNQVNDKYRIVFKDYFQYYTTGDLNFNRPIKKLNLDIASGNIPDIIIIDPEMNIRNYTSKNMFVDLYEFFDNDQNISRDDILGCVRSAYEINEKLYHLPQYFKVDTLVGTSLNVGNEPYMTIAGMLDIYNNIPDDKCFISMNGRYWFTNALKAIIGDFINYETGKCDFTCDDFINLLKFAKNYSLAEDYTGSIRITAGNIYNTKKSFIQHAKEDSIYLIRTTFENIDTYIVYKFLFDLKDATETEDKIVFKGYPTESGSGAIISSDYSMAITETSKVKEGTWEFIKYLLSDEIQSAEALNEKGVPVLNTVLKDMLEKAQEYYYYIKSDLLLLVTKTSRDDNVTSIVVSKYSEPSNYYPEDEIYRLTKGDAENIYNFLNNIEIRNKNDEVVMNIAKEELDIFWSGQNTAEQCAAYIQNRVYIYVNEQR